MQTGIDVRRFPWIRPLVAEYAHDFSRVAALFAGDPAKPAAWRDTIARVTRASRDRAQVAAIVSQQLARRNAPAEARRGAEQLALLSSVAIVTGQQAGVFGGPLYTLLKAITAIQLARTVAAEHGVPVVPVFWIEADDHDWAEVRATTVLDAEFAPRRIAVEDMPGAGSRPVAAITLDDRIGDALTDLEGALAPTEFTADLMDRLRRHYHTGATLSSACASWLDDLLGRHGLVVYEAADQAAKPLVAGLFAHEIEHADRTSTLVRDAGERMRALGHAPQLAVTEDGTALFHVTDAGRQPIKRRDGGLLASGATRPAADLAAEARAHPEHFSPGVALRPLVQDRLFPTIAYVGGPSELAYQAQLLDVYRAFGVEPPLLISRVSATLLDSGAARFLERYDLQLEALQPQDDSSLNALLERQLPPAVGRALEEAEQETAARIAALKDAVVAIDATLGGAVDTTVDRMRESLKTLHHKIVNASKKKDETLRRQFTRTRALTFPGGTPQERALGIPFFINRAGMGLVDRLLETLPLDTSQHYVITL